MKVFITGGAGFIGEGLVAHISSEVEIVVVDSLDPQVHKTSRDFSNELGERATCIRADVRDVKQYIRTLDGSDVVVHLAAQTGTGQSMYEISKYVHHNVDGTAMLLEAIASIKHRPKRIVLASSRAVYGEGAYTDGVHTYYPGMRKIEDLKIGKWDIYNEQGTKLLPLKMQEDQLTYPVSVYGLTKLWQEQLIQNFARAFSLDFIILRLQNVYGPKQELYNPYTGIIGIFINSILQKNEVELFEDGLMTRDFVYVADAAQILAKAILFQGKLEKIVNFGSGAPTSLKNIIDIIGKIINKKPRIIFSKRFRVGDIRHAVADMDLFEKVFSMWSPTDLETGLRKYLNWYLSQNPQACETVESSLKEMERKGLLMKQEKD